MQILEAISIASDLMRSFNIQHRDTYDPAYNWDDFWFNNGYGKERQIQVCWSQTATKALVKTKLYDEVQGKSSVAYDRYLVLIPIRYLNMDRFDVLIHECVHFLQVNTRQDDNSYIDYLDDNSNYEEYIKQRCELEAHIVQVDFICKKNVVYANSKLSVLEFNEVVAKLDDLRKKWNDQEAFSILVLCVNRGLIG
jgi:hypothetical protein